MIFEIFTLMILHERHIFLKMWKWHQSVPALHWRLLQELFHWTWNIRVFSRGVRPTHIDPDKSWWVFINYFLLVACSLKDKLVHHVGHVTSVPPQKKKPPHCWKVIYTGSVFHFHNFINIYLYNKTTTNLSNNLLHNLLGGSHLFLL